jgi:hypothetical protein
MKVIIPNGYLVHEALTRQYDGTGVYIQIENADRFVRIFHPDVDQTRV